MQPFIYGVFYISQKSMLLKLKIKLLKYRFLLDKSKKPCNDKVFFASKS